MAGDVYSEPPHTGRGGWTWYTGSAGWLYRSALENILGFRLHGDRLTLAPCVPADWEGYEIALRHGSTIYTIRAVRRGREGSADAPAVSMDGKAAKDGVVEWADDGRPHTILLLLG